MVNPYHNFLHTERKESSRYMKKPEEACNVEKISKDGVKGREKSNLICILFMKSYKSISQNTNIHTLCGVERASEKASDVKWKKKILYETAARSRFFTLFMQEGIKVKIM